MSTRRLVSSFGGIVVALLVLVGAVRPTLAVNIADYTSEFQAGIPATGWTYQWNSLGAIGNSANYTNLLPAGGGYDSNGVAGLPDAEPGAFISLHSGGGHPGRGSSQNFGGSGNTLDRYAIASYTIQPGEAGPTFITDSFVRSPAGNVDTRVYVNNTEIRRFDGIIATNTNINGFLGNLNVGDKVFVAVGPQVTDGSDSFLFDFTLATSPTVGASTSASYQADFLSPAPKQGWQYLWNSNGAIGNPLNYKPMQFNGSQYELDTDGTFPDSEPAAFLSLNSTGGHPGRGSAQAGALNRYTIAAFTVPDGGAYTIDGFIDALGSGENDLIVHVNGGAALINLASVTGLSRFNSSLGFLNAGDTIYVAAGPGATGFDFSDNFAWNFNINRIPEPATASLLMLAGVAALRRRRVA